MSESARTAVAGDRPTDDVPAAAWRTVAERGGPALVLAGILRPAPPDVPDAVADTRDVRVVWANAGVLDLLGLGAGELDGVSLPDAAPQHRDGQSWQYVVAALLRGRGGNGVGVVRRPDESTRRVHVRVTAVDGGWVVLLEPHGDDDRGARSAAAEAEHRFRTLAEHAPIGIFLSDGGLRLGYVNAPFADLLGTDPGALSGTAWIDAVHLDDRGELLELVHRVLNGHAGDMRVRLQAPVTSLVVGADGRQRPSQRWLHLRLAPTTTLSRAAGFVGTAEDVTERRAWEEQMSYQAYHDPLTGLVNRRRLVTVLGELLSSRRGGDRAFGILFFDLDGFKEVNDTYGHEAGDRVLVEVAKRMQRTARELDVLARIAGDEFVVVLRSVPGPAEAEAAARRHLAALAEPFTVAGRPVLLSASVGIALPSPHDTPETLLRAADTVMYAAKAQGPGNFRTSVATGPPDGPDLPDPAGDPR